MQPPDFMTRRRNAQARSGHRSNSSTGYQGRLSEALVDIRKGNVVSEHPVEVRLLQGTLNANRLDIIDSGEVIRFHGGVVMDMTLNQPEQSKAGEQR